MDATKSTETNPIAEIVASTKGLAALMLLGSVLLISIVTLLDQRSGGLTVLGVQSDYLFFLVGLIVGGAGAGILMGKAIKAQERSLRLISALILGVVPGFVMGFTVTALMWMGTGPAMGTGIVLGLLVGSRKIDNFGLAAVTGLVVAVSIGFVLGMSIEFGVTWHVIYEVGIELGIGLTGAAAAAIGMRIEAPRKPRPTNRHS